ncbi:hypothetical protein BDZ94DRAFT_506443 [Collybia nuda]|uniref:Uncharacterized protein n=1 Tax=Collybia nuda TaxID=64659 RepID=A0A9P6CFS0_9AGAR|nr:hypothetical protein BDZ94DRAFT_506443 [Collybia nuda]
MCSEPRVRAFYQYTFTLGLISFHIQYFILSFVGESRDRDMLKSRQLEYRTTSSSALLTAIFPTSTRQTNGRKQKHRRAPCKTV